MFEATIADGVLQLRREGTRWLSTGWDGGRSRADAAYNLTVPEGWSRTDLETYVEERLDRAGFDDPGPALLTGVDVRHARGARLDPVVAYATVGLSNPAALPIDESIDRGTIDSTSDDRSTDRPGTGTVNLIVGTDRSLSEGGLANLIAVVAEAKAATLLELAGVPGTTTDAIVVADDEAGPDVTFTGSGTPVGDAARACVREAVQASFRSRYADRDPPESVAEAEYGTRTDRRATVFVPERSDRTDRTIEDRR